MSPPVPGTADLPQVDQVADRVDRPLRWRLSGPRADVVVLDPPRTGAKRAVVEGIVALAGDVAIFAEQGYVLRLLRASTRFRMTHHVECVALITR